MVSFTITLKSEENGIVCFFENTAVQLALQQEHDDRIVQAHIRRDKPVVQLRSARDQGRGREEDLSIFMSNYISL